MKTVCGICLLALGFCFSLQAQHDFDALASVNNPGDEKSKPVAEVSYTHASYKGGQQALHTYLSESFVYTSKARENGFEGTIIVRCTISASGQPENARIVQSVHPIVDERAAEVVLEMPAWEPATRNGVKTRSTVDIPFELKLR
jgi:protein TonB